MGFVSKAVRYAFFGTTLLAAAATYDALDMTDNLAARLGCETYFGYVLPKRIDSIARHSDMIDTDGLEKHISRNLDNPDYRNLIADVALACMRDEELAMDIYRSVPDSTKNMMARAYMKGIYESQAKRIKSIFEGGGDE